MGIPFMIFLAAVGAIVVFIVVSYNRLVSLTQRSQSAWSDVDVQLKRRTDLVPNLVESVKGYAAHERGPSMRS
jgi:LemA protein